MTGASEQLRSIVDRILRLKAEQDDLAADIREVYADAKRKSFDKTVLGQLVSYIRKRDKNPEKFAEGNAVFDLYLNAYEQTGTALATHTHEASNNPRAKASEDNGATAPDTDKEPVNSVAGDASRPTSGGGSTASCDGETPSPGNVNVRRDSRERPATDFKTIDNTDMPPLPAFLRRDKQARAV